MYDIAVKIQQIMDIAMLFVFINSALHARACNQGVGIAGQIHR